MLYLSDQKEIYLQPRTTLAFLRPIDGVLCWHAYWTIRASNESQHIPLTTRDSSPGIPECTSKGAVSPYMP